MKMKIVAWRQLGWAHSLVGQHHNWMHFHIARCQYGRFWLSVWRVQIP